MAVDHPWVLRRGDSWSRTVKHVDEDGLPVNISGRQYRAQLRRSTESETVDLEFTCTVTNGPGGVVEIVASASDTAELGLGDYVWDLEEDAGGVITTLLAGDVRIVGDVTR
jgi:hypothetical protein